MVIPVLLIKRRRYIRAFRNANAMSFSQSINPAEHGINNGFVFNKLVSEGSIKVAEKGRYYLDENREARVTSARRKSILITVVVLIMLALVFNIFK